MTSEVGVQVIDPQSWDMIFDRMRALPPSTRHVVMVTTVPVVYPQVSPDMPGITLLGSTFCFCSCQTILYSRHSSGRPHVLDRLSVL